MLKKISIWILALLLGPFSVFATHIVGGEVFYQHLGGDQYRVTLLVYRDCSVQTDLDDPAPLGVFNTATGNLITTIDMGLDSVVSIISEINSSCVTAPNDICVEVGYYTDVITLPQTLAGGYTLTYQRCCRNAITGNIVTPEDVGATYTTTVPGTDSSPNNSSPFFLNLPPNYICAGLPFSFDHGAFDPDGDVLVYELCTPYEGASSTNPAPDPPGAPPYTELTWANGFSQSDMLSGPNPFSIDPNTGVITATPGAIGNYVVGMCVSEYRNGVLLSQTRRDYQLNVVDCEAPIAEPFDNNAQPGFPFVNCSELVQFDAQNTTGFNVAWDFGDPTTTADNSTNSNPTWTYPGPGQYELTLIVYNPINPNDPLCADTVTQVVTIQDTILPDAGPDQFICESGSVQIGPTPNPGSTYQWTPTTGLDNPNVAQPFASPTTATMYTVTETDSVGCSGTDEVTVSFYLNPVITVSNDTAVCPNTAAQLLATGGVSYLWSPAATLNDPNISNPIATPVQSTTYVVLVTDTNGCEVTDSVVITMYEVEAWEDVTICAGDTAFLGVDGGVSWSWSPSAGLSDPNAQTPTATPTVTTTYLVTVTAPTGCVATDSMTVFVNPLPTADAGPDEGVCEGATVQLNASGGVTYVWTPAAGLSNPNISNPVLILGQSPTTLTVTVTDANGCSASDDVTITQNLSPTVDAGSDTTICTGESIGLLATGGSTYVWAPVATLSNPTIANPVATPTATTTYVVLATDTNGCVGADTVTISIFGINALPDVALCVGDTAQLGVDGGVSWTWSPSVGVSDPAAQNPTVVPTVTTTYVVSAMAPTGCVALDSMTVTVNQLPNAFAGFDHGVCAGETIQLGATGGVTYTWSPTTGLSDPNISDPVLTFSQDTMTVTVTVTDANGCFATDEVTVWSEPLPDALAGPDTTICLGESVGLFASGGEFYSWSPTGGLSDPFIANPLATPGATTTYTVTVGQATGNLVANGNFSAGNTGFTSDYGYSNNLNPEGLYSIVTDASTVHGSFVGSDHTGNAPLDSFLVVNGAGTPGLNVWCQTISVSPGTNYSFSTWVSTMVVGSPAILQFSINGQVLGVPFNAPNATGQWIPFAESWFSGTATTAEICILNQNTATGGNDFGIDDILFSTVCTSTAEVTVTVNPPPAANAGADEQFCIGDGVQLNASGGVSYAWSPSAGLNDPNISDPFANPATTTTYTVTVADAIGCENTDDVTVTVNPLPPASAGPNLQVCIGDDVVIQGSGGVVFSWDPPTFLDDANAQLPISTPNQDITYTVTVTDVNGCVDSDEMDLTILQLPVVSAGSDSTICLDGSLNLQASGATTYEWYPVDGLSDPNIGNPTASPFSDITYTVIGTDDNGCMNIDSVFIDYFRASAAPDSIICNGDSVQAFVSGGVTFNWTPSEGVSDPTSSSPFLSPQVSTVYTVTATSAAGCDASAEVVIDILSLPVSSFEVDLSPGCDGIFGNFDNLSSDAENYLWQFGDGDTATVFEPEHNYPPGQGYIITLIAYNNEGLCVDTMVLDLTDQWFGNDTLDVLYSTAFTPNYDGQNDCFRPGFDGHYSDCYELKIFDRWGILQFESTAGQNHCWDGRNKSGEKVPQATYYYIVSLNGMEHHGYVTLIE